jgi:hypothetical protein
LNVGRCSGRQWPSWHFALLVFSFGAASLSAQTVQGRVLDAQTELGVPQVLVEVLRGDEVVGRALSDEEGRYQVRLSSRRAETYGLRASRIGYGSQEFTPIQVDYLEVVEVTVKISSSPIPLGGLTVEVGRVSLRNAATYEGLYARRERALPVGQVRIVVTGDPEMQNASRVQDVLQWFFFGLTRSRSGCVDYYINGLPRSHFDVLNIPASMIEGVEYYVDGRFAPSGFFGGPCESSPAFRYSIVAVWFRREVP